MSERLSIDQFNKHHWNVLYDIEGYLVVLADAYKTDRVGGFVCDLQAAGLITVTVSRAGKNFRITLTSKGWKIAGEIRRNAANGGRTSEFVPTTGRVPAKQKKRALHWIVSGDTGPASIAIWAVMTGLVDKDDNEVWGPVISGATPNNGVEFGKCVRLLELMPEWRRRLDEVARMFPAWGPVVASWDTLARFHNKKQAGGGSCQGKVLAIIKQKTAAARKTKAPGGRIDAISRRKCAICGEVIGETGSKVYQVSRHKFIHGHCLTAGQSAGSG